MNEKQVKNYKNTQIFTWIYINFLSVWQNTSGIIVGKSLHNDSSLVILRRIEVNLPICIYIVVVFSVA